MSDKFDEFMRELERRRAEAEARARGDAPPTPPADDSDTDAADAAGEDDAGRARDDEAEDGPIPLTQRSRAGRGRTGSFDRRRAPEADAQRGGGGPRGGGPGGGGPRRPAPRPVGGPDDGGELTLGSILRRLGTAALVIAVIAILALVIVGVDLWTDAIWYESVGFDDVFWTRLGAQVALFAGFLALTLVVLLANLWIAGRIVPPASDDSPGLLRSWAERMAEAARQAETRGAGGRGPAGPGQGGPATIVFDGDDIPDLVPMARWLLAGFAVIAALGTAGLASGAWETFLLWVNRVPYAVASATPLTDPVFGRDISFFLFDLPFWRTAQTLLNGVLIASLVITIGRYAAAATRGSQVFSTPVRVHIAIIAGLFLLSTAAGYQLDKFELVYTQNGVATGVSYADANARFMAYDVLTFLSGLAAALLVAGAFTRWIWPLGAILVVWFAASVGLGRLYPEAVQRLVVDPNRYVQEERYIANNIAMTRAAFDIDGWERRTYRGESVLTEEAIAEEDLTFANARLWDYRPLQQTLDQLQTVRQYYDFVDVDTDRYIVDGDLRQVMLSGRELALEKNTQATGWVNERLIYTHGIGMAMVPVNEVTTEGQPRLWIRDLPPVSSSGAPTIKEPRIYFGERTNDYVIVGARQAEFDYPRDNGTGEEPVETRWNADSGIRLDSTFMRLLFGLRFRDLDLVISDQVTADSQLLFHRTIRDRLPRIAPFLRYDKDPYLVIDNEGRLVYVQDAYTTSDRFPHATPFAPESLGLTGLGGPAFNYIRNSVKITMNAYDGRMTFYVADDADPLIRAWQGIFPTMFRPLSELGDGLVDHLRQPEEGFNVQTRVFGRYHVTQPLAFFNGTDLWTVPQGPANEQSLPSEAYYVVMRMPGEAEAEFLLLQPMIPTGRPNMIAWVAARNDPANRGQVRYYQFPAETTVFGPAQIEARIDQDPVISAQVTLWSQAGSNVIRGNLIVIPVDESLIYLQPVYLQSTSSAFPEFQKIVVASPTTVVWGDSLGEALRSLLQAQGGGPSPTPSTGPTPTPGPSGSPRPSPSPGGELPSDIGGLIEYANTHFDLAQAALRDGDFARYGEEIAKVEAALQRLDELGGGLSPAP